MADSTLDRLDAPPGTPAPLAGWLSANGFCDAWRVRHPENREYSCYSETHKTLSRIDTVLVEFEGLQMVGETRYLPRVHSDHSPMLLDITLGQRQGIQHWWMEANWLQEEYVKIKCTEAIQLFWKENQDTGSDLIMWEAFKTTLRGVFMVEVSGFKKQLTSSIHDREHEVSLAGAEYVRRPTKEGLRTLQDRTRANREVLTDQTTKFRLVQRRRIFEFGDKNSRLLAYLEKPDYAPTCITSIYDQNGVEVSDSEGMLRAFTHFYKELYKSCVPPGDSTLKNDMDDIDLPRFTSEDCITLDADITVEEVEGDISSFAPRKSPGLDGMPS